MGRGTKSYINDLGHMTKMAATPIYEKNPLEIFFSGTDWPILSNLGMYHRGLEVYKVYITDGPGLSLT